MGEFTTPNDINIVKPCYDIVNFLQNIYKQYPNARSQKPLVICVCVRLGAGGGVVGWGIPYLIASLRLWSQCFYNALLHFGLWYIRMHLYE